MSVTKFNFSVQDYQILFDMFKGEHPKSQPSSNLREAFQANSREKNIQKRISTIIDKRIGFLDNSELKEACKSASDTLSKITLLQAENALESVNEWEHSNERHAEAAQRIRSFISNSSATTIDLSGFSLNSLPSFLETGTFQDRNFTIIRSAPRDPALPVEEGARPADSGHTAPEGNNLPGCDESYLDLSSSWSRKPIEFTSELVKQICQKPLLRKLNISDNPIGKGSKSIPESIIHSSVEELIAQNCKLTSVPPKLLQGEKLRKLDLSGNQLLSFPVVSSGLCRLEELVMHNMNVPEQVKHLSSLKRLDISKSGTGFIVELKRFAFPNWIRNLQNLEELIAQYCFAGFDDPIVGFPLNGLKGLTSLKKLDLSYSVLRWDMRDFEFITTLPNLIELKLVGCGIRSVIDTIFSLRKDCVVHLDKNAFSGSEVNELLEVTGSDDYKGPKLLGLSACKDS